MSNRRLPFGYRMEMGVVEVDPPEKETVRQIFREYLAGVSLKELTDHLNDQPIRYDGQRDWNKNMVARIISDARYTGEGGFPQIISVADLREVSRLKASKPRLPVKTEAEKVVRQLSGHRPTALIMEQVLKLLNTLSEHPEQITMQTSLTSSGVAATLRRDLDQTLSRFPLDEDRAKLLSMRYAEALYEMAGNGEYETARLRQVFSDASPMDRLDASLLRSAVSEITLHSGGAVSLTLKNLQVIGVDKNA